MKTFTTKTIYCYVSFHGPNVTIIKQQNVRIHPSVRLNMFALACINTGIEIHIHTSVRMLNGVYYIKNI